MPLEADWSLVQYEDGILTVSLNPPLPIGGWNMQVTVMRRFGGTSGLIVKSVSSGYNNASGINITSSGNGTFKTYVNSPDTSGLDYGNYAFVAERLDSGFRTCLVEGYFTVNPNRGA